MRPSFFCFAPQFTAFLQRSCLRATSAAPFPSTMPRNAFRSGIDRSTLPSYFRDPRRARSATCPADGPFWGMLPLVLGWRQNLAGKKVRRGSACALPNRGHGFERRKNGKTCFLGGGAESQLFNRLFGGRLLSRVQAFGQPGRGS